MFSESVIFILIMYVRFSKNTVFRTMRNMFNDLLVILCMADLSVIFSNLVLSARTLFPDNKALLMITPWSEGLCHVAISASTFMTITIAIERYCAVSSPFTYKIKLTKRGYWWSISYYVIPVIISAIILNIPRILQIGKLLPAMFRDHKKTYIMAGIIYQIFHPLLTTCVIPIIVLCILNHKIIKISKQRLSSFTRMAFEVNLAKIMITIVIIFIIFNIPRMLLFLYEVCTIPNIIECYERKCPYYISSKRWLLDSIIRFLVMLNSSINFIIYCFMGSTFRRTLKELVK